MNRHLSTTLLVIVVAATTWWWWEARGTSDVELWLAWIQQVMTHGPRTGYVAIHADYPPGASLVLWVVGRIAAATSAEPRAVLRIALLAFLFTTTAMLFAASRRAGLTAFAHAALVLNAFGLMYLDILTAPFVVGAIWAATSGRLSLMTGLLAAACLMKWQPLLVTPFVLIYALRSGALRDRTGWHRMAMALGAPAGLILLAVLVYGLPAVYDSLNRAGHHNDLSNFGANPLWILTWLFEKTAAPGRQSLSPEGLVSIMAASRPLIRVLSFISLVGYGTILRMYWRSADRTVAGLLRFSIAGYLVYFMCSTGVHENHLFLASLLALLLAWQAPQQRWVAVILAVAANLNLLAFYRWQGDPADRLVRGVDVTVWVAVAISIAIPIVVWRLTRPPSLRARLMY